MRTSIASATVLLTLFALHQSQFLPRGRLDIAIFDVGQGSSTLLTTPSGRTVLIDGGPDTSVLEHLGAHMGFLDRTIDLVVLTHPHSDHVSGLLDVLHRYHIGALLVTGIEHTSARYRGLLAEATKKRIPIITADPEKDIDMGDGVVLDIVWPPQTLTPHLTLNDSSIVIRAMHQGESILLTGDIEEEAERALLASGYDIRSDILFIPHHGSRTSSSTGLLLAVDSRFGLLSVGQHNRFGHPHKDVMERYTSMEIEVVSTAEEGTIVVTVP